MYSLSISLSISSSRYDYCFDADPVIGIALKMERDLGPIPITEPEREMEPVPDLEPERNRNTKWKWFRTWKPSGPALEHAGTLGMGMWALMALSEKWICGGHGGAYYAVWRESVWPRRRRILRRLEIESAAGRARV